MLLVATGVRLWTRECYWLWSENPWLASYPRVRPKAPQIKGPPHKRISLRGFRTGRARRAIYYSPVESCKANRINPLAYLTYLLGNARDKAVQLPTPDEFDTFSTALSGGCDF